MTRATGGLTATIATVGLLCTAGTAQQAKPASMTGHWTLVQEPGSGPDGFRTRSRGPAGSGGAGAGGRFGGELEGSWMPPGFRELLRPKTTIEIAVRDTVVTVQDDAGWLRYLLPGKGTMREELGQGGPAVVESTWKKERLVTVRTMDSGESYREEYQLDGKTGRLVLNIAFTSRRAPKPFEIRRAYERAASPAAP